MKVGIRKPSPKKSFAARTTGKMKRRAKKAVNPFYGKKGMGFIKNPKRAVKGAVYRRTTVGVGDIAKAFAPKKSKKKRSVKSAPAKRADVRKAESKKAPAEGKGPSQPKAAITVAAMPPKEKSLPKKKGQGPQLQQLVHFPGSTAASLAFFIFGFFAVVFLFRWELSRALTSATISVVCFIYVGIEADRNRAANEALAASSDEAAGRDLGDPAL